MSQALRDLAAAGVAVWLDDLSRPRIRSGDLARSVERGEIVGITTNPTIFTKAIGAGSGYEDQVRDLALRGTAIGETLRLLTAWDVRAACDILRPVFDRTAGAPAACRSRSITAWPGTGTARPRSAGTVWLWDREPPVKIPATWPAAAIAASPRPASASTHPDLAGPYRR